MENVPAVRGLQRRGDLPRQMYSFDGRQRTSQRRSVDVLEHQVVRADVVNLADVRMVETGDGARVTLESPPPVGVGGELGGQHLDGDVAAQTRVVCLPHFTHSPCAKEADDLIWAQPRTRMQVHFR